MYKKKGNKIAFEGALARLIFMYRLKYFLHNQKGYTGFKNLQNHRFYEI